MARLAGISLLPYSEALANPGWFREDLSVRMRMSTVLTLNYPTFCIVYRDNMDDPDRLRFPLCHELGHLFMNHYRDYPEQMEPGQMARSCLEAEADAFARNLLAPVPVVDVIRYNRPRQARGKVFGLPRNAWINHDYLLGRRCTQCGHVFTDEKQENRCPACGASDPDWNL